LQVKAIDGAAAGNSQFESMEEKNGKPLIFITTAAEENNG
jgi:hypothetical protein